jgi:hypothetical protein
MTVRSIVGRKPVFYTISWRDYSKDACGEPDFVNLLDRLLAYGQRAWRELDTEL